MLLTIVSAVVVLGVLIFVHELGHFLTAKACGVGVSTFSLGFGPRLLGFRRGETDYRLSAIPLGGFVRMVGEDPTDDVPPEDIERSFSHKGVVRRMLIVAAGPLSNIAFALVVYYIVAIFWGQPVLTTQVGKVIPDMPAQAAGLQPGDVVRAVDGEPLDNWSQLQHAVRKSGGEPVRLLVQRGEGGLEVTITPKVVQAEDIFGETITLYQIGLAPSGDMFYERFGPVEALGNALEQTYAASQLILVSVGKMVTRQVSMKEVGGPIYIAQIAGEAARRGLNSLLLFAALISVNLAILNLLPIPALDGGHLLVFLVEAIIRRPVAPVVRERIQQVGFFCLMLLMVLVLYNDIHRIITQPGAGG